MARFIFLVRLLILVKIAYTAKFSKIFKREIGLYDSGPAVFSTAKLPSTINCVSQCLNLEGCVAALYHNGSEMCSFLDSNETLAQTSDFGYSYIYIGDHCMKGWIEFGPSCYLFGKQAYNWSGAVDFCETEDATLVEIETASENLFLQDTLSNIANQKHWIGLSDLGEEGVWVWTSGVAASYINWGTSQPNNGLVSNCGAIWASFGYKWVDEPCTNLFYPICEQASTHG